MSLRGALRLVVALNLGWFGVEFAGALAIGSAALFADSADFLEDAAINGLILIGLGWTAAARARLGTGLAALMLVPGAAFLWTLWQKLQAPVPPEAVPLTLLGLGALAVNLTCALVLARHSCSRDTGTGAAASRARPDPRRATMRRRMPASSVRGS